jgi:glycosyltransferase involved in cell wall biosynthesis
MAWKLLRPWLRALRDDGYELHLACSDSGWVEHLIADGFRVHKVSLRRRINPFVHIAPLWQLYRLIRRERFEIVNTHSPIAGLVGRIAAWMAGAPLIVYTVHGFYFHDDMPSWKRALFVALEWLAGKITSGFMFVSDEDRITAQRTGISSQVDETITIYNGVDLSAFPPARRHLASGNSHERAIDPGEELRIKYGVPPDGIVVGTVGRVVREKGYFEFAEMAGAIAAAHKNVYFLVVGDALPSDRDGIVSELRERVAKAGLTNRFSFAGFTDHVAEHLQAMDIFVLASYREGLPRSVLEAMSTGLPVIATNIRGCREAVAHEETGFIVPPRDSKALVEAVTLLLNNRPLAAEMGIAGRRRVETLFDQKMVAQRFTQYIRNRIQSRIRTNDQASH